jgi:hypothetical protein
MPIPRHTFAWPASLGFTARYVSRGVIARVIGPRVVALGGDPASLLLSDHDGEFMANAMIVRLR